KYKVGDIVTIEVGADYHTSPIITVVDTVGDVNIVLLIAADNAFINAQVIKPVSTYYTADSGHPSLSISKYIEGAVLEQASGCRVNNMSLDGFSTGQLASFNFGFEGLNFDRSVSAQPHTADFDNTLPPIILNACVYQDGTNITINDFAFSVENSLGFATSTCSPNGKISGRATERNVSGSFNPYKQDNSVSDFDKFDNNTEFSLSGTAYIPSATAGEYGNVVSFYLPNCTITELSEGDKDGILQELISFSAGRGPDGTEEEIYISFS
ncbi:hypothetical protein KAR91_80585, partial [Candidatus Pacearchaeota archaeon]|nr:hypothetical protein [Candidatus Pacearchaeota archaeon]